MPAAAASSDEPSRKRPRVDGSCTTPLESEASIAEGGGRLLKLPDHIWATIFSHLDPRCVFVGFASSAIACRFLFYHALELPNAGATYHLFYHRLLLSRFLRKISEVDCVGDETPRSSDDHDDEFFFDLFSDGAEIAYADSGPPKVGEVRRTYVTDGIWACKMKLASGKFVAWTGGMPAHVKKAIESDAHLVKRNEQLEEASASISLSRPLRTSVFVNDFLNAVGIVAVSKSDSAKVAAPSDPPSIMSISEAEALYAAGSSITPAQKYFEEKINAIVVKLQAKGTLPAKWRDYEEFAKRDGSLEKGFAVMGARLSSGTAERLNTPIIVELDSGERCNVRVHCCAKGSDLSWMPMLYIDVIINVSVPALSYTFNGWLFPRGWFEDWNHDLFPERLNGGAMPPSLCGNYFMNASLLPDPVDGQDDDAVNPTSDWFPKDYAFLCEPSPECFSTMCATYLTEEIDLTNGGLVKRTRPEHLKWLRDSKFGGHSIRDERVGKYLREREK